MLIGTANANSTLNQNYIAKAGEVMFKVKTQLTYDETIQNSLLNRNENLLLEHFASEQNLQNINISIDFQGRASQNFVSNLTLRDIAIVSKAYGKAIVIEKDEDAKAVYCISLPFAQNNGFIDFDVNKSLRLTVTNNTSHVVDCYAVTRVPITANFLLKLEKNIVVANQHLPITNKGFHALVLPKVARLTTAYKNGVVLEYEPQELSVINNQYNFIGVVSNNVCLSNVSDATVIDMTNISQVNMQAIDEDTEYFVQRIITEIN